MRITNISNGKRIIHIQDNWKQLYFNNKMIQVKYEQTQNCIKNTSLLTDVNKIVKTLIKLFIDNTNPV